MATRLKKTDVVIVGLGAVGRHRGAAPHARRAEVIGLEAGPRLSFRDFPSDEIRNDIRAWMCAAQVRQGVPTHRFTADQPAGPPGDRHQR